MRRPDLLADKWIALAEAVRGIASRSEADKVDDSTDRRREWDIERTRRSLAADELYAKRCGEAMSKAVLDALTSRDQLGFWRTGRFLHLCGRS
jgi:hypothetical protein